MDIDDAAFYDESKIAIVPMGFCYPGASGAGDNPPRRECAAIWHERLLSALGNVELTLLVGQYAQRHYLGKAYGTMTETVRAFAKHGPKYFPLPHPSWRSGLWMKKNMWFEETVLPELRQNISRVLG